MRALETAICLERRHPAFDLCIESEAFDILPIFEVPYRLEMKRER